MLTQQGYAPDDILPEGKKVNLRRNSNISTGGDSIDVTETIDSSYQELAAAMATSMGPGLAGLTSSFQIKLSLLAGKTSFHLYRAQLQSRYVYSHLLCLKVPGQSYPPKILDKLFSRSCHKSNLKPNS